MPIVVVIFVVERCVWGRGGLSSLCKAQLSLQVIYLSLHGLLVIPSLGHVTTHTGMASAGLRGVYASFSKPFVLFISITLRVRKVDLLLGSSQLRLMEIGRAHV